MTLEEVKALSDEELRIRVAELLGWLEIENDMVVLNVYELRGLTPDNTHISHERWRISIPQYPKDLNACHEMEKTMTAEQCRAYDKLLNMYQADAYIVADSWRWHASARQRCESFVLVTGGGCKDVDV